MSGGRATARVLGTLAVLLVAGLLLWGAGSGEPLVGEPTVRSSPGSTVPDDAAATNEALPLAPGTQRPTTDEGSGLNLTLIVQVATAALVAWLVVRWLRHREPRGPTTFVTAEPVDELTVLVQATAPDAAERAERDGEPRNTVVACWVALEDALARAGAAPMAGETALDLTHRVLGRWQVDPTALTGLAELFREARFSRHPITAAHAESAIAALNRIHEGLAQAAAERAAAQGVAEDGANADDTQVGRT